MADVVSNTQLVKRVGSGGGAVVVSGEAIIVGNTVYKGVDGNWYLAWANTTGNSVQAGLRGVGIALASAPGVGQPVSVFTAGTINMGSSGTLVKGQTYVLSSDRKSVV